MNVHVRELGRLNQRYASLFRDYLRADRAAADSYGELKGALAVAARGDWDMYYAVKDPACDLIIVGAEEWALRTAWDCGEPECLAGPPAVLAVPTAQPNPADTRPSEIPS